MDALTYQSITGLTNYEGFKSQLKNSRFGELFNIEDENIIFNRVYVLSKDETTYSLNSNQVAVILNVPYAVFQGLPVIGDYWESEDVNYAPIHYIGEGAFGLIVSGLVQLNGAGTGQFYTCQFAIFDLF
jgi:hypothetical protein